MYIYISNEEETQLEVFFDDFKVEHVKSPVVQMDDYYPFGLTFNSYQRENSVPNMYQYNGKEKQDELGLDWLDYGARMYQPDIGRWSCIDPKASLVEMSSPFVYSLNNPVNFIDLDGELPIFINGKVSSDSERANESYWSKELLNTIKSSGIANPGGEVHYVDGDRGFTRTDARNPKGRFDNSLAMISASRKRAGSEQAKLDFETILAKLKKDPETGKIIEKIQIYTHSRGSAFGEGYTDQLIKLIKQNASKFKDAKNVVEFSLNLAPHQSNTINAVDGVPTVGISHDWDPLSGDDINGATNLETNNGVHGNSGFVKEVQEFLGAFLSNDSKVDQKTIDKFITRMKRHGIDVEVSQ